MPDKTTTPTSPTPATKNQKARADQDQEIANDISDAERILKAAKKDDTIMALLTPRGFTLTKIGEGLTLQALAQAAFNTRQTSIGGQQGASSVAGGDDKTVRQAYADFPETARANFTSPADRSVLGLNGKVPADFEKFLTTARASYQAAKGAAYSDTMAEYGYPSDKLDDELDSLMDLENSATDHNSAQGAAQTATKVRNQAHATLMTWMRKFRRIAKVALRGQPDLRQKLAM